MPNRLPIAAVSVEIPTEQSVLESFTLSRLLDLARLFGCEIHEPSMSKDRLIGRLGRHLQGTLPALLGELSRDELRLACRRHGFFAEPKDTGREKERKGRLDLVRNLILLERRANDANRTDKERQNDVAAASTVRDELMTLADEARGKLTPFHWWLEFPEVFFEERPDALQGGVVNGAALMEGVVGNPSFLGGKRISTEYGDAYASWLTAVHSASTKNVDLSAHFFRRTAHLLGENGAFGLVATNTIAQGDTRLAGLATLVGSGWKLFDATTSMPWPGSAAVTVSLVHGAHGRVFGAVSSRLDGRLVEVINSLLRPGVERSEPVPLMRNQSASFNGVFLRGDGFTLSRDEGEALQREYPNEASRIRPYQGGEEVNTRPDGDFERYAIDLSELEEHELSKFQALRAILDARVRPYRESLGDTADDRVHKLYWWRFARARPELYAALAPLARCLVTARVSKHVLVSFQPSKRIFSEQLYVFPLDGFTAFATLQSRIHESWAWLLSSTMRQAGIRYSASDCFETFPFPNPDPRSVIPELESGGQALYDARAKFMVDTNQGLTRTYNALKDCDCTDPRILELRHLHEAMDCAVLDAYGWSDVAVPPYCPLNDEERAQVAAFEDEVIDRLYVLNAERAAEEQRLGSAAKPCVANVGKAATSDVGNVKGRDRDGQTKEKAGSVANAKGTAKKARAKKGGSEGQGSLF